MHPGGADAIARARWPLIAVAAAGIAVTAIVCYLADNAEEQRLHNVLELRVAWRAQDFERKIDAARESLVATAVFLSSQDTVDAQEFSRFTSRAQRNGRPIAALDWVPRVTRADRATLEATETTTTGKNFRIVERGPGGQLVPAGDRDEFFPILYQTRFDELQVLSGFDMSTEPVRLAAMQRARDTGRPKATLFIQGLSASGQRSYIGFWPVYGTGKPPDTVEQRRAELRGFVVGAFRVGAVLMAAMADTPDIVETIDFHLDDESHAPAADGTSGPLVARYSPDEKKLILDPSGPAPAAADRFARGFDIMGQRWGLEFLFSPDAVAAERSNGPLAVLIAGLLLTCALVTYASRERSQLARVHRLVEARTAALSSSEDRIRRQAAILQDAVDALADGFVLYDAEDRLVLCNDRYRAIRDHDPLLNKPGVRFEELARSSLARGQMPHIKDVEAWIRDRIARHRNPAGPLLSQLGEKWFRVSERRTSDGGTVAIHTDITEMKRAEAEIATTARALRDTVALAETANAKLQTLIDASPLPIVSLDTRQCVMIWNPAAERSFGYTAEEVLGRPYPLPPETAREEFDGLFQKVMDGAALSNIYVLRRHKDGRMLDVVFSGAPLRDADRRVVGAVYILEDVTEKRKIELQLSQAQKMEAVGQLSGGIAHDFNNILGVIIGNLDQQIETLQTATGDKAQGAEIEMLGNEALNAALRGAELVRRLLAFSRNQPLQPKAFDVAKLVRNLEPMLGRTLGEQITIDAKIPGMLWPVTADPAQFENVVLNLAINARDAMPNGGKLEIACRNVTLDESDAAAKELHGGDYVVLSVADTGTGIPAEILPRVFEPFFTTKEVGKGSGLGLSTVYGYARQSGGTASIYSEIGHGTEVRIYLPRSGEAVIPPEGAGKSEPAPQGHELILIVEDKTEVRDIARKMIESLGYSVMQAEDGAAALTALDRAAPDLLFTDIVMPGKMNGIDVAHEARRRLPNLPIVFTSGFSNPETVHSEAVALGATLISKPYRKVDLAKLLRAALDRAKNREDA